MNTIAHPVRLGLASARALQRPGGPANQLGSCVGPYRHPCPQQQACPQRVQCGGMASASEYATAQEEPMRATSADVSGIPGAPTQACWRLLADPASLGCPNQHRLALSLWVPTIMLWAAGPDPQRLFSFGICTGKPRPGPCRRRRTVPRYPAVPPIFQLLPRRRAIRGPGSGVLPRRHQALLPRQPDRPPASGCSTAPVVLAAAHELLTSHSFGGS